MALTLTRPCVDEPASAACRARIGPPGKEGIRAAAVVTVDLYGRSCNYTRIVPELERRGVPLVEDAADALGASHNGKPAGSFGVGAALSSNGNKIMTTSGGGMLLSDDGDLIDRARFLSSQARQPVPWYEHTEVGYNYRMSNVRAGVGIAQLSRLDDFIAHRRRLRDHYGELAASLPGGPVARAQRTWERQRGQLLAHQPRLGYRRLRRINRCSRDTAWFSACRGEATLEAVAFDVSLRWGWISNKWCRHATVRDGAEPS